MNTVRHYHRLGLLEEPTRRYNGYKQYGIEDLVRLLRIRRLVGLGVPLTQIQSISSDGDNGSQVLRQVGTYLAAEVERLRKERSDIAAILRDGGPGDTSSGFGAVAPRLSPCDSSLLHVIAQLCDEDALPDLKRMLESDPDPVGGHVRTLPGRGGSTRVDAIAGRPPADDVLRSAWDHLLGRPREVQAVLTVVGPSSRVPLLDRLVRRGDLRRPSREMFGSVGLHELQEGEPAAGTACFHLTEGACRRR